MIPLATPVRPKFRPEFNKCFHCGVRLCERHNATRRSCLDCEDKMHKAIGSVHSKVKTAIKRGELKPARDFACVDCGMAATVYDHRDYAQPFEIAPVCRSCNNIRGPGKLP